ncbi:hypothetical protein EU803_11230 [Loktanella sp. IMCC34160]|uniref:hypothetical protein n=1 Tax=Loktanella sp. IMCC34160 TaxID=2510646 RepID=UPI00101DE860|nr:hypothetical protein [Loktanella sp. IMCC34160]RYG90574.1 hypothetical protein EU803_11230 [Loktanella sp. IMCC34160]
MNISKILGALMGGLGWLILWLVISTIWIKYSMYSVLPGGLSLPAPTFVLEHPSWSGDPSSQSGEAGLVLIENAIISATFIVICVAAVAVSLLRRRRGR